MTSEHHPNFSENGADHPYLWLDNGSDDAEQVNELKEAETTRRRALSFSRRFTIATNLTLLSLLAFVPGTQGEHLVHGRDASCRHEVQDFPGVSAADGPVSNTVGHHPRRSLGTPDTVKDGRHDVIDNLSARSCVAAAFEDKSDESRAARIDAKPHLKSSSGEANGDLTSTSIGETGSMVRTNL